MAQTQARVPAWKRLGLRLKYAKETADESNTPHSNETNATTVAPVENAAPANGAVEHSRPSKRRRLSPPSRPTATDPDEQAQDIAESITPAAANEDPVISSTETGEPVDHVETDHDATRQVRPRRKSVTFTLDTKDEDGFSAKTLFKQSTSGQSSTTGDPAEEDNATPTSKKAKRKLRTQSKKAVEGDKDSGPPDYVQYLDFYANDKTTWKFNKKKQTDLLKNIFNLDHLPAHYDQAILQYVEGLQGAAARKRVAESAEAALKGIAEKEGESEGLGNMESSEARRSAYASALKRQIERYEKSNAGRSERDEEQLEELRQDVELGKRAENLFELLQDELHSEKNSASITTTSAPPSAPLTNDTPDSSTAKRKNRKSRTQASSSDDSESEHEKRPMNGPKTVSEALKAPMPSEPVFRKPSAIPEMHMRDGRSLEKLSSGKRVIFDDDMLDSMFPKKPYEIAAAKRKGEDGRGKVAKAESSSESSSESDSDSDEE